MQDSHAVMVLLMGGASFDGFVPQDGILSHSCLLASMSGVPLWLPAAVPLGRGFVLECPARLPGSMGSLRGPSAQTGTGTCGHTPAAGASAPPQYGQKRREQEGNTTSCGSPRPAPQFVVVTSAEQELAATAAGHGRTQEREGGLCPGRRSGQGRHHARGPGKPHARAPGAHPEGTTPRGGRAPLNPAEGLVGGAVITLCISPQSFPQGRKEGLFPIRAGPLRLNGPALAAPPIMGGSPRPARRDHQRRGRMPA